MVQPAMVFTHAPSLIQGLCTSRKDLRKESGMALQDSTVIAVCESRQSGWRLTSDGREGGRER